MSQAPDRGRVDSGRRDLTGRRSDRRRGGRVDDRGRRSRVGGDRHGGGRRVARVDRNRRRHAVHRAGITRGDESRRRGGHRGRRNRGRRNRGGRNRRVGRRRGRHGGRGRHRVGRRHALGAGCRRPNRSPTGRWRHGAGRGRRGVDHRQRGRLDDGRDRHHSARGCDRQGTTFDRIHHGYGSTDVRGNTRTSGEQFSLALTLSSLYRPSASES